MTAKSLTQAFATLNLEQQAQHLARWACALTIDARDTYIPGTEAIADPVRLRKFNEFQHRLTNQLRALLEHDTARFTEEEFCALVVEAVKELHAKQLASDLEKIVVPSTLSSSVRRQRRAGWLPKNERSPKTSILRPR